MTFLPLSATSYVNRQTWGVLCAAIEQKARWKAKKQQHESKADGCGTAPSLNLNLKYCENKIQEQNAGKKTQKSCRKQ